MIQFKRGNTEAWDKLSVPLADGQPGYDKTQNKLKVGNGVSQWKDLPYLDLGGADYIIEVDKKIVANDDSKILFYHKWDSGFIECWSNATEEDFSDFLKTIKNRIFENVTDKYFEIKGFWK